MKTSIELSVYKGKLFFLSKCSNKTCSVVTLVCLVAISGHPSEANLNNFVALIFSPVLEEEPVGAV